MLERLRQDSPYYLIHRIHRELFARNALPVSAPSRIRHSAYLLVDETDRSRKSVWNVFQDLLRELDISPKSVHWEERAGTAEKQFADGTVLRLIWELHTEFYSYTTILIPPATPGRDEEYGGPFTLPVFPTMGTKLVDLDIMVVNGNKLGDEQRAFLHAGNIYGGRVGRGGAGVWTTFRIDEHGQGRYLVAASDLSPGRLGRLIRRLVEIENYYHLILVPLPEYRSQICLLRDAEKRIVKQSESIAAYLTDDEKEPEREHEWLVHLTGDLAELIQVTEHMRYRLSAATSYYAIIEERLKWLKETSREGYQSIVEFVSSRVSPAVRNYYNFIERADALTNQLTSLANMMRTRVNLSMERQNLETMKSMKQRVELQLLLQRTVEGLSIIVLSYYLTALGGYIFKALDYLNILPLNPTLWTASTIPIWILFSLLITYRAKAIVEKFSKEEEVPAGNGTSGRGEDPAARNSRKSRDSADSRDTTCGGETPGDRDPTSPNRNGAAEKSEDRKR